MTYYRIGTIDGISALCLGGGAYGSSVSEHDAHALLDHFIAAGGTFIDTAHVYGAWAKDGVNGGCGNSEVVIGRWMEKNGCRRRVIIGTKGGHPDFDTAASCMTQAGIMRHLQESLDHLRTDYIDVYWLHRDDPRIPVTEMLGWMQEPVNRGVIRALACSNWRAERLGQARAAATAHGLPLLHASQIAWSLAQPHEVFTSGRYGEQVCMDDTAWAFHRATQVPVAAYSAQAGGLFALFDAYDDAQRAAPDFPKRNLLRRYGTALTQRRCLVARALAADKHCTSNQIALAWLLHQPFPVFPVIGPGAVAHLADALAAPAVRLSPDDVERLRQGA